MGLGGFERVWKGDGSLGVWGLCFLEVVLGGLGSHMLYYLQCLLYPISLQIPPSEGPPLDPRYRLKWYICYASGTVHVGDRGRGVREPIGAI